MQKQHDHFGRHAVYADAFGFGKPVDVHQQVKSKNLVLQKSGMHVVTSSIDNVMTEGALDLAQMIRESHKAYNISPDPADYYLVPCLGLPTNTPNRNGVAFPTSELMKFSTDFGMLSYRTWVGKGTYIEHANQEPLDSTGVIVDTSMRRIEKHGMGKCHKVMFLQAFDRNKHPWIDDIVAGRHNTYSMGAMVGGYHCSYCGERMYRDENDHWNHCVHLHPQRPKDFYVLNGRLVYRTTADIGGFENSAVKTPAYSQAMQVPTLYDYKTGQQHVYSDDS